MFTPRALGRPSRVGSTFAPSTPTNEVEVEDQEAEVDSRPAVTATPRQLSRETMVKHQQTLAALATPRALPAPPAGGFRNRTRATPSFSLFKSPAHPVLAPTADSDSEQEQDGQQAEGGSVHGKKGDELSDIRRKLSALRRKSILDVERREQRYNERRMTIGADQPVTPARRATANLGFYTVNPGRIAPQAQSHFARSPSEAATQEETTIAESAEPVDLPEDVELEIEHELDMAQEPEMDQMSGEDEQEDQVEVFSSPARTVHLADILPQKAEELALFPSSDTSLSSSSPRRQPPTPSFAGVKGMLYPTIPLPPKTPNLSGVKSMLYPSVPTTSTPVYSGMRDLYQLPDTAQTPDLTGLKSLYGATKGMSTPRMDGLREMYESEVACPEPVEGGTEGDEQNEPIDQVEVSEEEDEEVQAARPAVKSLSAPTRRTATKANSAPTRRAITPVEEPTHIPAKRARAAVKKAEPSVSAPTRTRAAQVASTSSTTARATASRARKATAAVPDPPNMADEAIVDKPVTRTRATRATATVEAGVASTASRARSAPTRGKAVLGERTDQPVDLEGPADKGKAKKTVASSRSRKPEVDVKSVSMPTRRRKVDQENVPEVKEAEVAAAAKPKESRSAPTRRTAPKVVETEAVPVVATRTRSRR